MVFSVTANMSATSRTVYARRSGICGLLTNCSSSFRFVSGTGFGFINYLISKVWKRRRPGRSPSLTADLKENEVDVAVETIRGWKVLRLSEALCASSRKKRGLHADRSVSSAFQRAITSNAKKLALVMKMIK